VFGARTEGLPSQTHHEVDQLLNESMDVLRHDPVPAFCWDRMLCTSAVKSEVVESLRGYGDHKPSVVTDFVSGKQFEIEPPIRSFPGGGHRSGGRPRTPGEGWRRLVIREWRIQSFHFGGNAFRNHVGSSVTLFLLPPPCRARFMVAWFPREAKRTVGFDCVRELRMGTPYSNVLFLTVCKPCLTGT